jgi:hypothetical protein
MSLSSASGAATAALTHANRCPSIGRCCRLIATSSRTDEGVGHLATRTTTASSRCATSTCEEGPRVQRQHPHCQAHKPWSELRLPRRDQRASASAPLADAPPEAALHEAANRRHAGEHEQTRRPPPPEPPSTRSPRALRTPPASSYAPPAPSPNTPGSVRSPRPRRSDGRSSILRKNSHGASSRGKTGVPVKISYITRPNE